MVHDILIKINDTAIDSCYYLDSVSIALNANNKSRAEFKLMLCKGDSLLIYKGLNCDIVYNGDLIFSGVIDTEQVDLSSNIRNLGASSRYLELLRDKKSQIGVFIPEMANSDGIDEELNFRIDGFCGDIYTDQNDNIRLLNWLGITRQYIRDARKIECYTLDSDFRLGYSDNDTFKHCRLQVLSNRYWQRDVEVVYSNGYTGTLVNGFFQFLDQYGFIPAPPVSRVIDAYNGLSWHISDFSYNGLPKAGMYNGKIWNPNPVKCMAYRDTDIVIDGVRVRECTQTSVFNGETYYAMNSTAIASNRWVQELNTIYDINFNDTRPDDGFNIDNFTLDIRDQDEAEAWLASTECKWIKPILSLTDGDMYKPLSDKEQGLIDRAIAYVARARAKRIYQANQILTATIDLGRLDFTWEPLQLASIDSDRLFVEWGIVHTVEHNIAFDGLSSTKITIDGFYGGAGEETVLDETRRYYGEYEAEDRTGRMTVRYGNRLKQYKQGNTPLLVSTSYNALCDDENKEEFYGFSMSQNEQGTVSGDGFSLKIPEIASEKTNSRDMDAETRWDFVMLSNTITIKDGQC